MSTAGPVFKADRNQLFAVIAMLAAVFAFSFGEIAIGFALFAVAAVFSNSMIVWRSLPEYPYANLRTGREPTLYTTSAIRPSLQV